MLFDMLYPSETRCVDIVLRQTQLALYYQCILFYKGVISNNNVICSFSNFTKLAITYTDFETKKIILSEVTLC